MNIGSARTRVSIFHLSAAASCKPTLGSSSVLLNNGTGFCPLTSKSAAAAISPLFLLALTTFNFSRLWVSPGSRFILSSVWTAGGASDTVDTICDIFRLKDLSRFRLSYCVSPPLNPAACTSDLNCTMQGRSVLIHTVSVCVKSSSARRSPSDVNWGLANVSSLWTEVVKHWKLDSGVFPMT